MRKILPIVVSLFFAGSPVFGQRYKYQKHFTEGNFLLLEENYMRALSEFQKAFQYDSLNANINYKIGFCYLKHPTQKHLAESYLENAVLNVKRNYNDEDPLSKSAPILAYLYLGQAYHLDYKFDEAIKMYDTCLALSKSPKLKKEIERLKQMCHNAIERTGSPANVTITNMGDSINSEFPDFSPILSADERMLVFTHAGKTTTGAESGYKTPDDGYFEDIFVSYKKDNGIWSEAKILHVNLTGLGHEGAVGITPDGQTLLVYRDDLGDGNLYSSTWDGAEWSGLVKFGPEINSRYWEPSACLSPDESTLYFVSNRPGGLGGRDIYRCKKLPGGQWGKAQNMGPKINTAYDEESPFVHSNGKDFFFSSSGHATMGGFDIFHTIIDSSGGFSEVTPLPYPINTTDDDEFYVSSADNQRAYYASSHEDHSGFGEQDIYMISLSHVEGEKSNEYVALLKGKVIPEKGDTLPHGVVVYVSESRFSDNIGVYRPQRNGNFSCILSPGKKYIFSYQFNGKEFFKEEISVLDHLSYQEIEREIPMNPVKLPEVIPEKVDTAAKVPVIPATKFSESNAILLNVSVINLKDFKAASKAAVTISDNKGKTINFTADSSGKCLGIALESDRIYTISGKIGALMGEEVVVSTAGVKLKKIDKTVYASSSTETYNVDTLISGAFVHYFEFNQTEFEHYHNYGLFLAEIDKVLAAKGSATIKITASASHIPSRHKGGVQGLAKMRAETLEQKLSEYIKSKGIDLAKVKFTISSTVGGPPYKADFRHHIRNYEKFQFVEAKIK